MIAFVITMLATTGAFVALAGFVGQDMRQHTRRRNEVADLLIDPRGRVSGSRRTRHPRECR
jgi:hypothetical protein